MTQTPKDIVVNVVVGNAETFRIATVELIGFGTVGTLLDGAYEILRELDQNLAEELDIYSQKILDRFEAAEELLFSIGTEEAAMKLG